MRFILVCFLCILGLKVTVFAELSPSSCSLLRTVTSITTIVPEMAQLAMRYYRASSSSDVHRREKRFLFPDTSMKDGAPKGSVFEQMAANAFKDVNFTRVALLILNNNETMMKIRQNVDADAIIRAAMRQIDYEKLGSSLWYSAEEEFDLEYIIGSIINATHIDLIHDALVANGTLPEELIKSLHPNINVRTAQRMLDKFKNFTREFGTIASSSERLEDYLFKIIEQYVLTPMGKIIQKVKNENPNTLDRLVEIILDNVNKVVTEQFSTATTKSKISKKQSSTTTLATLEEDPHDDVKVLLYQCSIAIESIGHTARVLLKSFEQLYCTSVWE